MKEYSQRRIRFLSLLWLPIHDFRKREKAMDKKLVHLCVFIVLLIFAVVGLTNTQAQGQKKVGGGDITYKPKGAAPVLFSHAYHVTTKKMKCTDCHTKIFKMKKEDLKITKETHGQDKYCGVCHNGKEGKNTAFSQTAEADCIKCHKK